MTDNEWRICDQLALYTLDDLWLSPTEIPKLIWPGTKRHSAWASPICLRMVKRGWVNRNDEGHYQLTREGYRVRKEHERLLSAKAHEREWKYNGIT